MFLFFRSKVSYIFYPVIIWLFFTPKNNEPKRFTSAVTIHYSVQIVQVKRWTFESFVFISKLWHGKKRKKKGKNQFFLFINLCLLLNVETCLLYFFLVLLSMTVVNTWWNFSLNHLGSDWAPSNSISYSWKSPGGLLGEVPRCPMPYLSVPSSTTNKQDEREGPFSSPSSSQSGVYQSVKLFAQCS